MVILPLEEYEALIDEAFGPSTVTEQEESLRDVPVLMPERPIRSQNVGRLEESEAIVGKDVTIELDDIALLEGIDVEEGFDDEAEIDEAALIDLWKEPTAAREAEMQEKMKEAEQKPVVKPEGGEEQFYLEPID